jgi:hypothetical protein
MKVESSSRRRQNLSISEEGDLSVVVEAKETLRRGKGRSKQSSIAAACFW